MKQRGNYRKTRQQRMKEQARWRKVRELWLKEYTQNVSYECKKCAVKGTSARVESINLNEIKKLPCDCPAENGIFRISHFRCHKG